MANYGATRTKFKDRLKRRDCTDTLADGFLQDSVTRIQRVMRVPAGEKSVELTIASETSFPIPNDYLRAKDLTVNGKFVLTKKPLDFVLNLRQFGGTSSASRYYCRQGSSLLLAPIPVAGDVFRLDYWSEFEEASVPADETILLDIANDLVVYGALSYACDHWSDKRGAQFEQRFVQILSDLQAMGDDDELVGNAQVAPAFCYDDYVPGA